MVEIPRQLEIEPELRLHAKKLLETQRGIGRDPTLAVDERIDAGDRHSHAPSELPLRQTEGFQELLQQHLSWVRRRPVCGDAEHRAYLPCAWKPLADRGGLVIVNKRHSGRAGFGPGEADPVPVGNSDAVLANTITPEGLQSVAGWNPQRLQAHDGVKLIELALGDAPQLNRARAPRRPRVPVVEHILRARVGKRNDHGCRTACAGATMG